MKKLIIFALILLGFASCQKEVITPNGFTGKSVENRNSTSDTDHPGTVTSTDPNSGNGSGIEGEGTVDPTSEEDITDPLRKKDKN